MSELRGPAAPRRHLLSVGDLTRDDVERILETARSSRGLARPRGEEAADAARPDGREPLLRVLDAHARELRARREAALRGHDVAPLLRLVRGQGRVAEGHGDDARRVRPGRHRRPAPVDRRAAARRARARRRTSSTRATASTSIRRRRSSTCTRCRRRSDGSRAARRDRRRRPPLARRALARPGARARRRPLDARRRRRRCCRAGSRRSAARSRRTSRTSADADVIYVLRMQRERMEAGEAFVPSLREYSRALRDHARARAPRPGRDAPGADEPRRRDRPARRGLRGRARQRPGARGARRAHGGAVRPAHGRPRPRLGGGGA